jgi:dihydrodipicolinate synthase/N-acetylneuraminate lyase
MDKLRQAFVKMYPICEFMGIKGYIRVAHTACDILGHSMGSPRMPIRPLSGPDRRNLEMLLADAGLIAKAAA